MDNDNRVVPFGGVTKLDLPADQILQNNVGRFSSVVLIGWDGEEEFAFASSAADGGEVLWLLELAKKRLLERGDE